MNIDQIEIKPIKSPTLTCLWTNELFREITTKSYASTTYLVNGERCLGLTFENIDKTTISRLKKFCEKTLLDVEFINIPWRQHATIAFIRKRVSNWIPSSLKNISRKELYG